MKNFHLKKILIIIKKTLLGRKIAENKRNPKELWRTLKSLVCLKISLKVNIVVSSLDSKKNVIFFVGYP